MLNKMMKSISRNAAVLRATLSAAIVCAAALTTVACALVVSQPMGRIAYCSTVGLGREIALIRETGGAPIILLPGPSLCLSPSWSPDGTKIACVFSDDGGITYSINVMNADGSGRRELVPGEPNENSQMVWSPAGDKLYFTRDNGVFSVLIDSGAQTSIINGITISGYEIKLSCSPDGKKLAYSRWDSFRVICIIDLVRGQEHYLLNSTISGPGGSAPSRDPAWSPDGKKVYVYSASANGICAVSPELMVDEATLMPIPGTENANLFTLSSDGKKIAFAQSNVSGGNDVCIINSDGHNIHTIYTSANEVVEIHWAPDGHRLLVSTNSGPTTVTELISAQNGGVEMTINSVFNPPSANFSPR